MKFNTEGLISHLRWLRRKTLELANLQLIRPHVPNPAVNTTASDSHHTAEMKYTSQQAGAEASDARAPGATQLMQ